MQSQKLGGMETINRFHRSLSLQLPFVAWERSQANPPSPASRLVRALIAVLIATGILAQSALGPRTFVSPDKTFELRIPSDYAVYTGRNVARGNKSYMPICESDAFVCVVYKGARYEATNFQAAGVEVKLTRGSPRNGCVTRAPGARTK